jgi:hypothetical protein
VGPMTARAEACAATVAACKALDTSKPGAKVAAGRANKLGYRLQKVDSRRDSAMDICRILVAEATMGALPGDLLDASARF